MRLQCSCRHVWRSSGSAGSFATGTCDSDSCNAAGWLTIRLIVSCLQEAAERAERLSKLSDASIEKKEDAAAARRQALLQARVAEAKASSASPKKAAAAPAKASSESLAKESEDAAARRLAHLQARAQQAKQMGQAKGRPVDQKGQEVRCHALRVLCID